MTGKVPEALREQIQTEGLILMDEGILIGLRFKKYKAPNQRFTGIKHFGGYGALTQKRFVSKGYSIYNFDLPLDRISKKNVQYGTRKGKYFYISFEASDFYDDRSGWVEVRLPTLKAEEYVRRLDALLAAR